MMLFICLVFQMYAFEVLKFRENHISPDVLRCNVVYFRMKITLVNSGSNFIDENKFFYL